ncbi:MAG: glycosyltransferase family 2 protein [Candidatus Rifleibacteriota bacterium]
MKKIRIIIPCYNEQDNIIEVLNSIEKEKNRSFKPLVVDDCSIDNTYESVRQRSKVDLISLPINLGVGGAVQAGLKFAKQENADHAVKFDGDGQHPSDSISPLVSALEHHNADIVIGSRFINKDQKGFRSTFFRRIGIRLLQMVCFLLTGQKITDPTSGLRAYSKKAIHFMADNYPSFDYPEPEEIILAIKNGLKIVEIPVEMSARKFGQSSITSGISFYYMIKVVLSMIFIWIRGNKSRN